MINWISRRFALALVRVVMLGAPLIVQAAPIFLSNLPAEVSEGEVFSFGVSTSVVDLYAFQFDLQFGPAFGAVASVVEGKDFGSNGGFFPGLIDNGGGSLSFVANSLLGPTTGLTGDLELVKITMTAIGEGDLRLNLEDVLLLNSSLASIEIDSLVGGVVGVSGVPEPASVYLVLCALAVLSLKGFQRIRIGI